MGTNTHEPSAHPGYENDSPIPPLETCPRMILSGKGVRGDLRDFWNKRNRSPTIWDRRESMVTVEDAKKVAQHLVKTMDPVCVIVFGSVAKTGKGEDIDLLIVTEDKEKDLKTIDSEVHKLLKPFYGDFAIDPFVVPRLVLRKHFLQGSPFLRLVQREGRCLYMKDSIDQWFRQAREDMAMAECLFNNKYYRGACYHSQQAIEKGMKGVLIKKGWELEKAHSIRLLTSIAQRYGISSVMQEEDMDFIDSIYRGRYPAEEGLLPIGEPTMEDAMRAVKIASDVIRKLL